MYGTPSGQPISVRAHCEHGDHFIQEGEGRKETKYYNFRDPSLHSQQIRMIRLMVATPYKIVVC